jgi:TonB family protein
MRILRRGITSRFLLAGVVVLVLGSVSLGQSTPDKASDETAGQSQEPVYKPGKDGVTAPRPTYRPNPEFSEQARQAKYQGTVVLTVTVSPSGKVTNVKVLSGLGMGLDEKAIEAVRRWKFEPATKDGKPVAVQVAVEVTFRLYK